jgi:hypothetical protein
MKKPLILFIALLISSAVYSQIPEDILYLNNDSVVKGTIIAYEPEVIIRTNDGYLFSYKRSEIAQITKSFSAEYNEYDEYGNSFSYGVAIGGGGVFGLPIKFQSSSNFAFELGMHYRPGYLKIKDPETKTYFKHSLAIAGGPNFYFGRHFKESKQKIKSNGLTIKGGVGFGGFTTLFIATGWINETFKNKIHDKSFTLELGPMYAFTKFSPRNEDFVSSTIGLYLKLQWNSYAN